MQQILPNRPPPPQFWGTSDPRLLQSPPELGDLGGDQLLQRLFDLVLMGRTSQMLRSLDVQLVDSGGGQCPPYDWTDDWTGIAGFNTIALERGVQKSWV